ncbi:MAG: dTDP-4-dehydrorhamnose 3,5-epimerase [Solirubrobacterales bacterium]|nr:dTDP-4-dehydrorhamnose 3,5-epimerase [Solirubrobacterales bacterium]
MRTLQTRLDGPILLEPNVFGDVRGFFTESFRVEEWAQHGITDTWVQDNHSRSGRGVVRGMHVTVGAGQAKLVRCARGAIFDVVVDLRAGSPTFGEWEAHVLDDERMLQLYVPLGFAHGFCVLSEAADVLYKVSSPYDADLERGFRYDDPDVGIAWPTGLDVQLSRRDVEAPRLREVEADLRFA